MNLIRQKQIHKLEEDISSLYLGSDVFERSTTFSLGIPEEGEARLDSSNASQVTTLQIHTTDSVTGNRFVTLSEFQQYDTLIIKTKTGEIAKYEIDSILPEVDTSNEGHFILTLQHSFGYSNTLSQEILGYYFRKSASDELIENNSIAITLETNRALAAEALLAATISGNKYTNIHTLTNTTASKINHGLGTKDIIVQVIGPDGILITHACVVSNYRTNSVDILGNLTTGDFKIIIMK